MVSLSRIVLSFLSNRSGATAVEYTILAGGIALSIFVVLALLGTDISNVFEVARTALSGASSNITAE